MKVCLSPGGVWISSEDLCSCSRPAAGLVLPLLLPSALAGEEAHSLDLDCSHLPNNLCSNHVGELLVIILFTQTLW